MRETKELYGFVISSKIRKGILETLNKESPLMQSEIAKRIGKKQQDISKEIPKLEKENLIECLTKNKKSYKIYIITDLGKEVFNYKF